MLLILRSSSCPYIVAILRIKYVLIAWDKYIYKCIWFDLKLISSWISCCLYPQRSRQIENAFNNIQDNSLCEGTIFYWFYIFLISQIIFWKYVKFQNYILNFVMNMNENCGEVWRFISFNSEINFLVSKRFKINKRITLAYPHKKMGTKRSKG